MQLMDDGTDLVACRDCKNIRHIVEMEPIRLMYGIEYMCPDCIRWDGVGWRDVGDDEMAEYITVYEWESGLRECPWKEGPVPA